MNMPNKCRDCVHVGDYTTGPYGRLPHYCCELIWQLLQEDYRVDPNKVDKNCPLKDVRIASYIAEREVR